MNPSSSPGTPISSSDELSKRMQIKDAWEAYNEVKDGFDRCRRIANDAIKLEEFYRPKMNMAKARLQALGAWKE